MNMKHGVQGAKCCESQCCNQHPPRITEVDKIAQHKVLWLLGFLLFGFVKQNCCCDKPVSCWERSSNDGEVFYPCL